MSKSVTNTRSCLIRLYRHLSACGPFKARSRRMYGRAIGRPGISCQLGTGHSLHSLLIRQWLAFNCRQIRLNATLLLHNLSDPFVIPLLITPASTLRFHLILIRNKCCTFSIFRLVVTSNCFTRLLRIFIYIVHSISRSLIIETE